jgi:hypothetical protein
MSGGHMADGDEPGWKERMVKKPTWSQLEAIDLATQLEEIAPEFGAHVALTGGCLYRDGRRKDVDILFYRIRQVKEIDEPGLLLALQERLHMVKLERYGWVQKMILEGKHIDLFFPESKNNHQFPMRDGDTRNAHYFSAEPQNEDLA